MDIWIIVNFQIDKLCYSELACTYMYEFLQDIQMESWATGMHMCNPTQIANCSP